VILARIGSGKVETTKIELRKTRELNTPDEMNEKLDIVTPSNPSGSYILIIEIKDSETGDRTDREGGLLTKWFSTCSVGKVLKLSRFVQ